MMGSCCRRYVRAGRRAIEGNGDPDPSAVVVGGGRDGMCWVARRRGLAGGAMVVD
jgi:hypothetical protein